MGRLGREEGRGRGVPSGGAGTLGSKPLRTTLACHPPKGFRRSNGGPSSSERKLVSSIALHGTVSSDSPPPLYPVPTRPSQHREPRPTERDSNETVFSKLNQKTDSDGSFRPRTSSEPPSLRRGLLLLRTAFYANRDVCDVARRPLRPSDHVGLPYRELSEDHLRDLNTYTHPNGKPHGRVFRRGLEGSTQSTGETRVSGDTEGDHREGKDTTL